MLQGPLAYKVPEAGLGQPARIQGSCFVLHWVFVAELRLSLVAVRRGHSLVVVHGLLIVVAPCVAEHGLQGLGASGVAACGLSSCGSQA